MHAQLIRCSLILGMFLEELFSNNVPLICFEHSSSNASNWQVCDNWAENTIINKFMQQITNYFLNIL